MIRKIILLLEMETARNESTRVDSGTKFQIQNILSLLSLKLLLT
jgi:hypothetical protein